MRQRDGVKKEEFDFDGVRFVWRHQIAVLVQERHFFAGAVRKEVEIAISQALDEVTLKDVDSWAAGAEAKASVTVFLLQHIRGHVTVFDDVEAVVEEAEMAEFFGGVAFDQGAAADVSAGQVMQADEEGVELFDEWVIDLPIGDGGDAAGGHIVQCAGIAQGGEAAAVAIWRHGEAVGCREQGAAVVIKSRQHALDDCGNVSRVQAEIVILLEEIPGCAVIDEAGHDIPGDSDLIALLGSEDAFGKQLEQGFLFDWGGRVGAFGAIIAETRALAAGDCKGGYATLVQEIFAMLNRLGVGLAFFLRGRR